MLVYRSP